MSFETMQPLRGGPWSTESTVFLSEFSNVGPSIYRYFYTRFNSECMTLDWGVVASIGCRQYSAITVTSATTA
eukprot:COSAG02_NODE_46_length_45443_cov_36.731497_3_plen_72_part_00